jgi:hypothetical protein
MFMQLLCGTAGAILGGAAVVLLLAVIVDPKWVHGDRPFVMPAIWLCSVLGFSGILAGGHIFLSVSGFFRPAAFLLNDMRARDLAGCEGR